MKGNTFAIRAISLLIVGLMIAMSAAATPETSESKEIETNISWNIAEEQTITKQADFVKPAMIKETPENALPIPLFEGMHPAIAASGSSIMLGLDDIDMQGTWFSASSDAGETWTDAGGWEFGQTEYASIDHWAGTRYVGTMTPDFSTSGQVILCDFVDATDTNTWLGAAWDWESYNFYDFFDIQFAAGDDSMEDWRLGFWAISGYCGYDTYDLNNCPLVQYPTGPDYATISWYIVEGCTRPASDVDKVAGQHYAIWQMYNASTGLNDIFIRIDNTDYNPDSGTDSIGGMITTGINNENMDICANDDNVIIVTESDGTIFAYYSLDGFDSFEAVEIDQGANPRITETEDGAIVTFVKGGMLYSTTSSNGGASWGSPTQLSEGSVYDDYHEADISEAGAVYTGTDDIIYFEPGVGGARPIITIGEISGGVGVTVEVENIGDADAEDVPYTLTATGGLLGMINKQAEGTISVAAGSSTSVSLPMIIGLGAVTIEVSVESASETVEGTQILFFTSI